MKKLPQSGFAIVILGLMIIYGSVNASAQNIRIEGTNPSDNLVVNVDEARLGDVLLELAKTFKFNIEGLEESTPGAEFSAQFTGNLEKILLHLLKNTNHLIVRMPNNAAGIAKIVIIEDNQRESTTTPSSGGIRSTLPGITRSPEKK